MNGQGFIHREGFLSVHNIHNVRTTPAWAHLEWVSDRRMKHQSIINLRLKWQSEKK